MSKSIVCTRTASRLNRIASEKGLSVQICGQRGVGTWYSVQMGSHPVYGSSYADNIASFIGECASIA